WIDDLSRSDTLFHLPFSLPFYGNEFNVLPILMMVTMIFQSKMTMQDPKQKLMVYIMPVFMLLIFNRFPAGLNLYYTMFNLLTIIQQKFVHVEEIKPASKSKAKKKKR
ncbi:MAG TPA: membrane protein insertase YidC, partial [Calditrichaeota bacterium]|nr:membrane protein insertase YidC [Calditrichota bacterium]